MAMERVTFWALSTKNQPMANSEYAIRKEIKAAIPMDGSASGSVTKRNAVKLPAPSRNAASSRSRGKDWNAARMFQMQKGSANTVYTSVNPSRVVRIFKMLNTMNNGVAKAMGGMTAVSNRTNNPTLRPGKRKRAKA